MGYKEFLKDLNMSKTDLEDLKDEYLFEESAYRVDRQKQIEAINSILEEDFKCVNV